METAGKQYKQRVAWILLYKSETETAIEESKGALERKLPWVSSKNVFFVETRVTPLK